VYALFPPYIIDQMDIIEKYDLLGEFYDK